MGYDAGTKTLEVEFQTGEIYQYQPVREEVYLEMLAAPSIGQYFEQRVKLKYIYRAIN